MILDQIVAKKREQRAVIKPVAPSEVRSLRAALTQGKRPRVIAEFKRRSPSAGEIRPFANPAEIALAYEQAGAAALSVLTDIEFFDGHPAHVEAARQAVRLPVLRKDFLLDERDVVESRQLGADAVLLIVRILTPQLLANMLATARDLGMDALVETHTDGEIDVALQSGAELIGVNHRDLDTLQIDLTLSARARQKIGDRVMVAESGIRTRDDVALMIEQGADAILVGEHLMRAKDPGRALVELCS